MNLRDLKPHLLKRLATEGEDEYDKWMRETNDGKKFGSHEPLELRDVWRAAYSKGASSILRRVDNLRDQ